MRVQQSKRRRSAQRIKTPAGVPRCPACGKRCYDEDGAIRVAAKTDQRVYWCEPGGAYHTTSKRYRWWAA